MSTPRRPAAARPRRPRQRHRGTIVREECARPSWHACRNRPHAAPRRLRVLLRAAATIVGCFGEVAQLVEHTTENRGVAGSIPPPFRSPRPGGRRHGVCYAPGRRTGSLNSDINVSARKARARLVACSGAESAARRADRGLVHGITLFTMSMSTASAAPTARCARWTWLDSAPARTRRACRASAGRSRTRNGLLRRAVLRSAKRRPGALHDLANEVVLRGPARRPSPWRRRRSPAAWTDARRALERLVDGVDELGHRLDCGPLPRLE